MKLRASLKVGRYGAYIQINNNNDNNNNVSNLSELKNKLSQNNINKEIVENLFKLKIMKEHAKQLISNCKSELELE